MKKSNYLSYISIGSIICSVIFAFLDIQYGTVFFAVIAVALCIWQIFLIKGFVKTCDDAKKTLKETEDRLVLEKQLHNEELQMMTEANRTEIENFRSILAHQVRMPLSIVQGYADLLARGMVEDEENITIYLGKIVEHSGYISNVLSTQLSAYRSVEDIIPVFRKVDIVDLVRQTGDDMQTIARRQGIRIQSISTMDSLLIDADIVQLNKVFFNLLENSIKYMGREGLVTIQTDCSDDKVFITVTDDGLGLPAEETVHIFEYNFQGSNRAGGHGHGLYLAQKAIEAHGGSVSATSSPGMGMSIKISLPINQPT